MKVFPRHNFPGPDRQPSEELCPEHNRRSWIVLFSMDEYVLAVFAGDVRQDRLDYPHDVWIDLPDEASGGFYICLGPKDCKVTQRSVHA